MNHTRGQASLPEQGRRRSGLPEARFDQQPTSGSQPRRSPLRDPALYVQTVGAAVERHPRFMQPGLRRHHPDRVRRDVWGVGHQDVNPAAKSVRQGRKEISFMHLSARWPDVAAGAADRSGVDVGHVKLNPAHRCKQSSAYGTRTTAKIDDDGAASGEADGLLDEVFRSAPGDEHAWIHCDVLAAELSPAQEVFKGQS